MTKEKASTAPYCEFLHISASEMTEKQIREFFRRTPWCCFIALPKRVNVIVREEFFAAEVKKIAELKKEKNRIIRMKDLTRINNEL